MKFWQKIFVGTLIIFVLAFDTGAYILTSHAYDFNRKRETESGIREQSVILSSMTERIANAEHIYADAAENQERLTALLEPFAEYYRPQGVILALYEGEQAVYADLQVPDTKLLQFESTEHKNTMDGMAGGRRYVFVASKIPDYPHLTLVYARDISQLDGFRREVSRVFILLNLAVMAAMGTAVYFLLQHMTKPIKQLSVMSAEIAGGAYDGRITLNRSDELGQLEHNFNRMAESIEENMAQLAQAASDRQQFIDDLTHEMKTPVTSILGYAEYLQKMNSTEEERELAAGHLYDSALRLKNLSEKLLELAYLRGEKIQMEKVRTADLFRNLESMTGAVIGKGQLRLCMQAEIEEVTGDETLLLSLLINLVENAAKASCPRGKIFVRAYCADGHPVLSVGDEGHGMAEEEILKVKEPFYRVDKSRSRKFGGVGLGLSIVSQIAALHGAKMEIDSAPGKGTTVKICFANL